MIQLTTSKFVSKCCFSRHTTTSSRTRLSRPYYRLALLLLACGLVLIFAPWVSIRLNRHVHNCERLDFSGKVFEFNRRQLLSPQSPSSLTSLQSASESVTWLPSTFARSVFRTFLTSAQPRQSTGSTARNDDAASGAINASALTGYTELSPLHLRRHVRRDYFEPNVALQDATRGSNGKRSQTAGDDQKSDRNSFNIDNDGSSKSANNQLEVCVAIASMPRVFPENRKLPPWHFPVSLLDMLERRRSPPNISGGFKDMNVVVYNSGCNEKRKILRRLKKQAAASDASASEEDPRPTTTTRSLLKRPTLRHVESATELVLPTHLGDLEERKKTMGVLHEKVLRLAGRESSLNVTVLPSRQDACDFVQEDEEVLRKFGVTDEMVGADGWKSWRWRTKLVMDFVYVMRQCMATKPKYILLLQDDTRPARLYDIGIEKFINEDMKDKEWTVLSLYYPESYFWEYKHGGEYLIPCCAQALLFKVSALEDLLGFVEKRFVEAPMDWLLNIHLTSANRTGYVHVPSLFQHVGYVRTKAPGVSSRPHCDRQFRDDYVVNVLAGADPTDIIGNPDYGDDSGN